MKITDIIRGILDLADVAIERLPAEPVAQVVAIEPEQTCGTCGIAPCSCEQEPDLLAVIQHLAGVEVSEPDLGYANQPEEQIAPVGAAFPGGDDMHSRKNPADIRTNAPSMYPGYQAGGR